MTYVATQIWVLPMCSSTNHATAKLRRILTCQEVPGEPTCEYVGYQFNDDHCDCPLCDDEPFWDCSSCFNGCPTSACVERGPECRPKRVYPGFEVQCPGKVGCSIDSSLIEDGKCECPFTCADETKTYRCPVFANCMGPFCPPNCADIECPTRRLSELELNKSLHRALSSASPHASARAPANSPQSSANTVPQNHLTTGSQGSFAFVEGDLIHLNHFERCCKVQKVFFATFLWATFLKPHHSFCIRYLKLWCPCCDIRWQMRIETEERLRKDEKRRFNFNSQNKA